MGRKPKQQHPEDILQRAIVEHLRLRGVSGLVWWHTVNSSKLGGARTRSGVPLAAIRAKQLGLRPGVSDLLFLHHGKFYALELKADGGKPSREQFDFMADVIAAGGGAGWTDNLDRALAALKTWGLIR